jgi:hypothetical protein
MTERYSGHELEEISLWFVPERTPSGSAPKTIRDQWVGVPLPVREGYAYYIEENTVGGYLIGASVADPTEVRLSDPMTSVVVSAFDAFKALRLSDRQEAANWWQDWFGNRSWLLGSTLVFQAGDGKIFTPEEIEKQNPDTSRFDEIE